MGRVSKKSHNVIHREYLSIPELSQYCGISERTLWDLTKSLVNPIPYYRIGPAGRIVRVKRSEFDAWISAQRGDQREDIDSIVEEILS